MTSFLLVADVDSTLIQDEVIELLAEAAGTREAVRVVTARAMAGELDFSESLRARVATLAGLPASVIFETIARVRPSVGLTELVEAVHARGGRICAVSGGFSQVLDVLGARFALDDWLANALEITDDRLTGRVDGEIVDGAVKARSLGAWAERWGIPLSATIAMGDGANDLEMMATAGLSIAYCAKPIVRERARVRIDRPDLRDAIAYLPD